MMIYSCQEIQQDTVPHKHSDNQDSIHGKSDSVSMNLPMQSADTARHRHVILKPNLLPDYSDTTSVCARNNIADITFTDYNNFIHRLGFGSYRTFPFVLIDKANEMKNQEQAILIRHLKPGKELPVNPLHADWMIILLLTATFLYSVVSNNTKRMLTYFEKTFVFKGLNDNTSKDLSGIFHWQSTILNLISFIVIGLFGYAVASFYSLVPAGVKGIVSWLIVLGIISIAVTIRHIVCVVTGTLSGQEEVFREYLLGIYHSYRFGAIFLFVFIILMSYTEFLPPKDYVLSGLFIIATVYLIRVIRLLIIFLKRNISIFYLILYLCALEILPVLIIVKYFTGLV
jgi:hypothetical protein